MSKKKKKKGDEVKFNRNKKLIEFTSPFTGKKDSIYNDPTIKKITVLNTKLGVLTIHYYSGRKHACYCL